MLKIFFSLLVFTSAASAEDCTYISQEQAERAQHSLSYASKVQTCNDCRSEMPQSLSYRTAAAEPSGVEGYWGLFVDGRIADLTYIYVDGKNLAHSVGCSLPHGVDTELQEPPTEEEVYRRDKRFQSFSSN